jgi:plastocyanin
MKSIVLTLGFAALATAGLAQQSMNISHQGANPDELNVAIGEEITFVFGGGGAHPMTEGWGDGSESTPEPFVTQTVTSSDPETTFTLEVEGIYFFHCATNPGNQMNWAKIIVGEPDGVEEALASALPVFPNPVVDVLNVEGNLGDAVITDLTGKIVLRNFGSQVAVSALQRGTYIISQGASQTVFVKQ